MISLDVSKTLTSNKHYVIINFSVKDTGIGIEKLMKIFKSFIQVDSSISESLAVQD
jgi:signal transduction histidine kinase